MSNIYQLETEDMLPRIAPKPSVLTTQGVNDGLIKPQVPEVSILFGQQDGNDHKQTQQTYAAWKQQVLPKVTFPQCNEMEIPKTNEKNIQGECHIYRSNSYPYRGLVPMISPNMEICDNKFINGTYINPSVRHAIQYRHSLENVPNLPYSRTHGEQQSNQTRKSLHISSQILATNAFDRKQDILTICAGTQTDILPPHIPLNTINNNLENFVTKEDFEKMIGVIQEIRQDQLRILHICETMLLNSSKVEEKPSQHHVATQFCEHNCTNEINNFNNDNEDAQDLILQQKFLNYFKTHENNLQTPKSGQMAQLNSYRINSLEDNIPHKEKIIYSNKIKETLSKHSSDKSLFMNELALKYLPNEKLTELLSELHISEQKLRFPSSDNEPSCSPLRNIENLEKTSVDMSNASYKYLKKYRLLPEDEKYGENISQTTKHTESPNFQLANVRQTPLGNKHQTTPYHQRPAERLPKSPLITNSPNTAAAIRMLNLDNIKQQPKLL